MARAATHQAASRRCSSWRARGLFAGLTAALLTVAGASRAHAGRYDIDLTKLGRPGPGGTSVERFDGFFRSLSSELGTVVAPRPADSSDSLGLAGFSASVDMGTSTISHQKEYWTRTTPKSPLGVIGSMQLMLRKGLWPGIEVGAGGTKMLGSRIWSLHGYAKAALHEGFHHLPIPSIALRASVGRVLGAKELRMTTISGDLSVSHTFGLGKSVALTPYLGYQALTILSSTNTLQTFPGLDRYPDGLVTPGDCGGPGQPCSGSEFSFSRQVIVRHRPFVGGRLIFGVFRVAFEAMFATPGKSRERVAGVSTRDAAGFQQQYTLSMGLDF